METLIVFACIGATVAGGYIWNEARPKTLMDYEGEIKLAYRRHGDGDPVDRLTWEISRILSEAYRTGHPVTADALIDLYLGTTMVAMCREIFAVWQESPARAERYLHLSDGAAPERGYCVREFSDWNDVDRPFIQGVLTRVYDWPRP